MYSTYQTKNKANRPPQGCRAGALLDKAGNSVIIAAFNDSTSVSDPKTQTAYSTPAEPLTHRPFEQNIYPLSLQTKPCQIRTQSFHDPADV